LSYIGKTPTPAPLTSSDISDGIIATDKLANNAVVTSKITDGTISNADVNATVITGQSALTSVASDDTVLISDTSASGALKKITKANLVGTAFNPDAAQVFNESGAQVDFRVESDSNANAFVVDGTNNVVNILGTSTRRDGGLNVNVPSSVLGTDGDNAQIYCRTQETDTSNNATVDVFRFLDAAGNQMGTNHVNGILYCQFGLGGNQYSVNLAINTCGNSSGTLTQIGTRTRGTSLVTANPVLPNDGASGAVKVRITYINNSGVVDNQKCVVTFVGSCV